MRTVNVLELVKCKKDCTVKIVHFPPWIWILWSNDQQNNMTHLLFETFWEWLCMNIYDAFVKIFLTQGAIFLALAPYIEGPLVQ